MAKINMGLKLATVESLAPHYKIERLARIKHGRLGRIMRGTQEPNTHDIEAITIVLYQQKSANDRKKETIEEFKARIFSKTDIKNAELAEKKLNVKLSMAY